MIRIHEGFGLDGYSKITMRDPETMECIKRVFGCFVESEVCVQAIDEKGLVYIAEGSLMFVGDDEDSFEFTGKDGVAKKCNVAFIGVKNPRNFVDARKIRFGSNEDWQNRVGRVSVLERGIYFENIPVIAKWYELLREGRADRQTLERYSSLAQKYHLSDKNWKCLWKTA